MSEQAVMAREGRSMLYISKVRSGAMDLSKPCARCTCGRGSWSECISAFSTRPSLNRYAPLAPAACQAS
jgi:hypothetical protein